VCVCVCVCVCVWYWIWTQSLHLEPLHWLFSEKGFFWDRVSWTICLGWLQTVILLISASWLARITGMSHWRLAGMALWSCAKLGRAAPSIGA
jgi:hypothetical protein